MKLIFESPINTLSLGNVGLNLLLQLWKKGVDVLYMPIGQPDVSNFKLPEEFKTWLQNASNRFLPEFNKNLCHVKNWHLSGSHTWSTNKRLLLSYHECDSITSIEANIIRNIDRVLFCGNYSERICHDIGLKNVGSFNLGFDSDSFYKTTKKKFQDNRIQWFLGGKFELRKNTGQIINLWAKKYGKKDGEFYKPGEQVHFLNLCVFNPFLGNNQEEVRINNERVLIQALEGQKYINIQPFAFLGREQYNDTLYNSQIDLTGLSSAESWNLPAFNMTALGNWSIVLNATAHKAWANEKNAILVQPNGKKNCADNLFFHNGAPFNQGQFYTFDSQDVIVAMETAAALATGKTENVEGLKLQEEFTYSKTVDNILKEIVE